MYAQAQNAESLLAQSLTKDDALCHAIRAAELYLDAARFESNETERARLRAKCSELLSMAEEIRNSVGWPLKTKYSSKQSQIVPASTRKITQDEKLILLESSKLNNFLFPPWISDLNDAIFENIADSQIQYTEPYHLKLSDEQKSMFSGWKRLGIQKEHNLSHSDQSPLMVSDKEIDLVQDTIPDCSVVSSLCAVVSRASKGHGQLISSVIYPKNKLEDGPAISPSGKYICRFYFNGCFRKVTIDDRLPVSNNQRSLHLIDRNNPRLLWPALIEKAYLKVRGGYNFPGSNSGTDLWVITGWIPEQIFLQSDHIELEQLWYRVYKAFSYGDVMITLGTGKLTCKEIKEFGLVGEHNYAILDMNDSHSRQLLVKNPWCDGMIWRSSNNISTTQQNFHHKKSVRDHQDAPQTLPKALPGVFWMEFQRVAQHFDSMYLNWNPALFRHRQDFHFSWEIPEFHCSRSLINNPQYTLRSSTKETIWAVLSRHFSAKEQNISASIDGSQAKASNRLGYISLFVFKTNGHRVYIDDGEFYRGAFVDSPQTLARFEVSPSVAYTIVVGQHGLPLSKYSFTLSFFSRFSLEVKNAEHRLNFFSKYSGSWSSRTAGGNMNFSTYPENPQFYISVPAKTDIELFLESDQQNLAVRADMVWAGGDRVTSISSKDIVGGTGDYRYGCALNSIKSVAADKYTIVCSAFESGRVGNYILHVGTSVLCQIKPLLSETAGRLSLKLTPILFPEKTDRMLAPLKVTRLTNLRIIARSKLPNAELQMPYSRPLLKLTLLRGRGPNKIVMSKSSGGEYSDAPMGVRLGDVNLTPNMSLQEGLWIVIERFGGRKVTDSVEIEVLSDISVTIGSWDTCSGPL